MSDTFERLLRTEASDLEYLNTWIEKWSDIVDFEVYPVASSMGAAYKDLTGP